jgi:hypothetical protein
MTDRRVNGDWVCISVSFGDAFPVPVPPRPVAHPAGEAEGLSAGRQAGWGRSALQGHSMPCPYREREVHCHA